jgi:hypothetical protein
VELTRFSLQRPQPFLDLVFFVFKSWASAFCSANAGMSVSWQRNETVMSKDDGVIPQDGKKMQEGRFAN